MKYLVLVSHGEMAGGLHSVIKMLAGDSQEVLSTSLKDGMGADVFAQNFKELIQVIKPQDEIILLGDLLGGSPLTNALEVITAHKMMSRTIVFGGMNLPMAITAVLTKEQYTLEELRQTLPTEGRAGVKEFVFMEEEEEEI